MADYFAAMLVAGKLGVSEAEIAKFESQGFLSPVHKNNRKFYPAKQIYRLRAALRLAQKHRTSLEEALSRLEARRLNQVAVPAE